VVETTMNFRSSKAAERALEYGLDLSLTEHNLTLTPEQRLVQHQEALNLVMALTEAGKRLHATESKSASSESSSKRSRICQRK